MRPRHDARVQAPEASENCVRMKIVSVGVASLAEPGRAAAHRASAAARTDNAVFYRSTANSISHSTFLLHGVQQEQEAQQILR